MKLDLKGELKKFYAASPEPEIVDVPELTYLMIDGHGDPNTAPEYAMAVQALYSVAYTAKFTLRQGPADIDFSVMPLEGLWWVPDMSSFSEANKDAWDWTLMILQPAQVTEEVFQRSVDAAVKKKPQLLAINRVRLERYVEGLAAQSLHVGPYSEEGPTIQRLHDFIAGQGYVRSGKHHEIYLSDPRRSAPEKTKTIIRQPVAPPIDISTTQA